MVQGHYFSFFIYCFSMCSVIKFKEFTTLFWRVYIFLHGVGIGCKILKSCQKVCIVDNKYILPIQLHLWSSLDIWCVQLLGYQFLWTNHTFPYFCFKTTRKLFCQQLSKVYYSGAIQHIYSFKSLITKCSSSVKLLLS